MSDSTCLSKNETLRYNRQIILKEIGVEGQLRLKNSRVLIVGVGGLGSPAALYLAAAGVGTIGLVDNDVVSITNLQRQILFSTRNESEAKSEAARMRLLELNPEVKIHVFNEKLSHANALRLIQDFDIVVDGTDNFKSRYLISHACCTLQKPHVYGGIFGFEGHVAVFAPQGGPCYRCLYPSAPASGDVPNCEVAGVLGALPGIIGSLQALETLKSLIGIGGSGAGQLFVFDALHLESRNIAIPAHSDCLHCGTDRQAFFEQASQADQSHESQQIHAITHAPDDSVWLDVRTHDEYMKSRLPRSINVPLAEIAERLSELDPKKNYIVYCHSGQRSLRAQELMQENGFRSVYNLAGGLLAHI